MHNILVNAKKKRKIGIEDRLEMSGVGVWKTKKNSQERPHWKGDLWILVNDEKEREQAKQKPGKRASFSKGKGPEV